jgi:hypothetical protein
MIVSGVFTVPTKEALQKLDRVLGAPWKSKAFHRIQATLLTACGRHSLDEEVDIN